MAREQSSYGKAGKLPISVLPRTNYTFHVKLLDDMSTWRGELKKMATNIARSFYNLQSCPSKDDPVAYVERAAAELVKKSMFLRDGFDENVSQCATVNTADLFFRVRQKTSAILLSNTSSSTFSTRVPIVSRNNGPIFSATVFLSNASP